MVDEMVLLQKVAIRLLYDNLIFGSNVFNRVLPVVTDYVI